ncbi:MAG: zinc ribbon domain-containing protein [Ilumatobacteraceae bacterium]
MAELVAYGAYVPYWRLERAAIAAVLGTGATKGSRSVSSFDEDSTSMAVEASRVAVAAAPACWHPSAMILSTTSPAYQDKTNATAIHAALRLPQSVAAYDFVGAVRSGTGALRFAQASATPSLVVLSDVRTGLAGGADEASNGDAAVAFAFGEGPGLVEALGAGSSTEEFLERWRTPGAPSSGVWEERFGEIAYLPLAQAAAVDALKSAGIDIGEVDHLDVAGLHARAVRSLIGSLGVSSSAISDDLTGTVGNTAIAHAGLLLADVLDRAEPGQTILVVQLADGADAVVLRTTDALSAYRERRVTTVAEQITAGRSGLPYAKFLRWRGSLQFEPPRRPDPDSPAAPPSLRNEAWKFGFTASQCEACGTRHLPPARVCHHCHAVDQMSEVCLANVTGTIRTYTVDHLAFSLSPPVVTAVVDFDGGGRRPHRGADRSAGEDDLPAAVHSAERSS